MHSKKDFTKVSHVSYTKEYVSLYKHNTTGIYMQISIKRTMDGYGLGRSKTEYFVGIDDDKGFKTYDDALKAKENITQ